MANRTRRLNNLELAAFCKQLHMVIIAGLPTYQGISILMEDTDDPETTALLQQLYEPMVEGKSLSFALNETGLFPNYMVEMIRLGEETGRLEEVLISLNYYYEKNASINATIHHAATYPVIMAIMMLAVIVVLIAKVLPVFSQIYEGLGAEITGAGASLIHLSNLLNQYMIVFVILFALLIAVAFILIKTPLGGKLFSKSKLSLQIASGRFANCMYLALASGLDTDQGMNFAKSLIANPIMKERISKAQELTKSGVPFVEAIFQAEILLKSYSSWISIGDLTGNMEDAMKVISDSYDEATSEQIEKTVGMIEPALVIAISIIIGLILISFMLPLLAIMSSIG